MTDLHAKIERAALAACKMSALSQCTRCCDACLEDEIAFLRALEAEGLKLMDGEVTEKMRKAAYDLSPAACLDGEVAWAIPGMFRAAFAAAPALADRLKGERA